MTAADALPPLDWRAMPLHGRVQKSPSFKVVQAEPAPRHSASAVHDTHAVPTSGTHTNGFRSV